MSTFEKHAQPVGAAPSLLRAFSKDADRGLQVHEAIELRDAKSGFLAHVHKSGRAPQATRTVTRTRVLRGSAAAVAIAASAFFALQQQRETPLFFVVHDDGDSVGHVGESVDGASASALRFASGSTLQLSAQSRVQVVQRGRDLRLQIEGQVSSNIVHAETPWTVTSGPFVVTSATGQMTMHWNPNSKSFRMQMFRGTATVDGPKVGHRMLQAGDELLVSLNEREPYEDSPTARTPPAVRASPEHHSNVPARRLSVPFTARNATASAESEASACDALSVSARVVSDGLDELVALERACRADHQRAASASILQAIRTRFAGSAAAHRATFELARLRASADPVEANRLLRTYVAEDPIGPFAREAFGRLLEEGSAGERGRAACEYLRAWPTGPHAASATELCASAGQNP